MIKFIISAFLVLTILIGTLVIYYWRDSNYDPSQMDLIWSFILLPISLCLLILSPYFIYKTIQYFRNKKLQQQKDQELSILIQQKEKQAANLAKQTAQHYTLNILSSAAWHCFGENEEIIQFMQQFRSPELDFQLSNNYGLPLLSYRITALDQWLEKTQDGDEDQSLILTTRERRIQQLIRQQLQKHEHSLQGISQQLKRSALFYESDFAYQYRIHPGWNPENLHENFNEKEDISHKEIETVVRLNRLNVYILLAENLIHTWDDQVFQTQLLQQLEDDYSFRADHLHIECYYFSQPKAYASYIELLQEIAQQPEQANLIIMVDSEIDQDWLDEQLWQNEQYIASEYAASWCLTAEQVVLEVVPVLQKIKISTQIKELKNYLTEQHLDLAGQIEKEQAFVLLLDETKKSKNLHQLQQTFIPFGVHPEFFIYIQSFIGNTQCLGHIFGMMLVTQMRDNIITITYSLEQENIYICCENKDLEKIEATALVA